MRKKEIEKIKVKTLKDYQVVENIEKCKVRIPRLRKNSKKFKKEAGRFNLRGFR